MTARTALTALVFVAAGVMTAASQGGPPQQQFALVRKIGIPYDARLAVPAETRFICVIVYDAAADRVGSAGVAVR